MKTVFIYFKTGIWFCQSISNYLIRCPGCTVFIPSSFDGVASFFPCGVAGEEGPYIRVPCLFRRDRGLKARGSTVPAAVEHKGSVFIRGQERCYHREVLLGNVMGARNVTGGIFHLGSIIYEDELLFTSYEGFHVFDIEVLDRTGEETGCRDDAQEAKHQRSQDARGPFSGRDTFDRIPIQ